MTHSHSEFFFPTLLEGYPDDTGPLDLFFQVLITIKTTALPIHNLEFPSITICPQGSRIRFATDKLIVGRAREMGLDNATLLRDLAPDAVAEVARDLFPELFTAGDGRTLEKADVQDVLSYAARWMAASFLKWTFG